DKLLQQKTALENERIENLRLADCETNCIGGLDPKSGRKIVGGGCGPRCKEYLNNAEAAVRQIAVLDTLQAKNLELQKEATKLQAIREKKLKASLSNSNSLGSVMNGWKVADTGVKLKIGINAFLLLFLEASALLTAHLPVSEGMGAALANIQEDDAIRRRGAHELGKAKIHAQLAKERAALKSSLPPVMIQLPPKRTADPTEEKTEPKVPRVPSNRAANDDLICGE
ncbi:MAG: hypothetical protein ACRD82_16520, partial [Blastocatellia bacterium]